MLAANLPRRQARRLRWLTPPWDERHPDWTPTSVKEILDKVQEIASTTPPPFLSVALAQSIPGGISPAEIAFLSQSVPETLIINELKA